jgi:CBS domain-containing protein
MSAIKTMKDVKVDVFDFPHLPYWFTLRQAMGIIQKSLLTGERCLRPLALLVFDEKYNLMGILGLRDIMKGLEPAFLQATTSAQVPEDESGEELALIWETVFSGGAHDQAAKPVGDAMVPARYFVQLDDPITKAACLMTRHNLILLPVLDESKKLVGVVREIEIFNELANSVLQA